MTWHFKNNQNFISMIFIEIGTSLTAFLLVDLCHAEESSGEDDSEDGFAQSIWGAYLFSILGIAAFVIILILLLHFVCGNKPIRRSKPKVNRKERVEVVQPEQLQEQHSFRNLESQQSQSQQQPYTSPNATELTNNTTTAYPSQQYAYEPYSPTVPQQEEQFISTTLVPTSPPPYTESMVLRTEEQSQGPFKYLEKYNPQSPTETQLTEESLFPKRPALRANTPYKVVEKKSRPTGESEIDGFYGGGTGTGTETTKFDEYYGGGTGAGAETSKFDGSYDYNNFSYQNNAFSHDDDNTFMIPRPASSQNGLVDSRFVRVLPRYPPSPPPKPGFQPPSPGFN